MLTASCPAQNFHRSILITPLVVGFISPRHEKVLHIPLNVKHHFCPIFIDVKSNAQVLESPTVLQAVIANINDKTVRPANIMAVAVESAVLDALSFNTIKTFEEQEKEVDKATLTAIADIFVRHSMHMKLGVGLLHRHDTLQDRTVMFHEVRSPESDICIPKTISSVDMDKIAPNSWFLNRNGMFQAFEYDASGEATQIDTAFASDLAEFLKAHSLEKRFSIIPNCADREDFVEFTHPSGRGTISVPLRLTPEEEIKASEPVITGWSFHVNEHGIVECKGNNVCAPMNSGNHKVFRDSKPYTEHEVKVMLRLDAAGEES
ncbi:hypothetical protein RJ035_007706 [Blastomyces gilchristii]